MPNFPRSRALAVLLLLVHVVTHVTADYQCVCNYKVESPVYAQPDESSTVLGYMYEFDCKPSGGVSPGTFFPVQFSHMLGYVVKDSGATLQTCSGDPPEADKVLTTVKVTATTFTQPSNTVIVSDTTSQPTTSSSVLPSSAATTTSQRTTSSKPSTTTIRQTFKTTTMRTTTPATTTETTTMPPTTTSTQRPTTVLATTLSPTTKSSTTTTTSTATPSTTTVFTTKQSTAATTKSPKVPEGHVELCPNLTKADVSRNHGFLGQYGDFCYEYVPYHTQWKNAQRHCELVSGGFLTSITTREEQDFILRFLQSHQHKDPVWIGLSDSNIEGRWEWTSGDAVGYTHFQQSFHLHTDKEHKLNDCVVLQSNGEWVDLPCGVPLLLGGGFGEAHAYVCQYNVTAKPPGLFEGFLPGFVIG